MITELQIFLGEKAVNLEPTILFVFFLLICILICWCQSNEFCAPVESFSWFEHRRREWECGAFVGPCSVHEIVSIAYEQLLLFVNCKCGAFSSGASTGCDCHKCIVRVWKQQWKVIRTYININTIEISLLISEQNIIWIATTYNEFFGQVRMRYPELSLHIYFFLVRLELGINIRKVGWSRPLLNLSAYSTPSDHPLSATTSLETLGKSNMFTLKVDDMPTQKWDEQITNGYDANFTDDKVRIFLFQSKAIRSLCFSQFCCVQFLSFLLHTQIKTLTKTIQTTVRCATIWQNIHSTYRVMRDASGYAVAHELMFTRYD